MAEELGVSQAVRFLGAVPLDSLRDLYQAADLFVMPSTGEGFGIVFLEAMASGTPALGLDSDGSLDPLLDGELGTATSKNNLCNAILRNLANGRPPDLPQKVQRHFGREALETRLRLLVAILKQHEAPMETRVARECAG